MFTSLEVTSLTSGKQRSRWSSGWKPLSRRFINQLICRLPLLAVWTLVVIFILYKSLGNVDIKNNEEPGEVISRLPEAYQRRNTLVDHKDELLIRQLSRQYSKKRYSDNELQHETVSTGDTESSNVITKVPNLLPSLLIDSTTKKSSDEYARLSKVFILIVQSENFHPLSPNKIFRNHQQHASKASNIHTQPIQGSANPNHLVVIPPHIRLLIDILKAHKIQYTIDTTRTGLPTSLLIDQDDSVGSMKQYSVIVIDDFVKYTKLSRWMRDQLDRHCRKNQIGVITYLTSIEQHVGQRYDYRASRAADSQSTASRFYPSVASPATEESLADQFPLTLKPVDKKTCHGSLEYPSCLTDYQLNEMSPILRVLKRKQNFILEGPLEENLDKSPWISMSSNHVTYEPLTWAKLAHKSQSDSVELRKRNVALPPSLDALGGDQKPSSADHNISTLGSTRMAELDKTQHSNDIQDYNHDNLAQSAASPESNNFAQTNGYILSSGEPSERQILSMFDRGLYDGIRRVIFGGANHHWLNRVLLLEAIEHLSSGSIITPLERYIQIDIDDIFVGEKGKRMNGSDVEALIETQSWLAQRMTDGFKFNLGFSGKYFKHGLPAEVVGDLRLVSKASEFTWFCHSWSHSKAHLANGTESIAEELRKNLNFAKEHQLPLIGHENGFEGSFKQDEMPPTYAVAPHHSGGK